MMNGFQIGDNSGYGYEYGNGRRSNEDVAAVAPFVGHFGIVDAPTGGVGVGVGRRRSGGTTESSNAAFAPYVA